MLCTLKFTVADDVEIGDILDIAMYYGESDFLYAYTDSTGYPAFVSYYPAVYGAELTVVDVVCNHVNTTVETVDATCAVSGYERTVCLDCKKTVSESTIPATGIHTQGAPVVTNPMCEVVGKESYYCTVCGEFMYSVIIPATGHSFLQPGATIVYAPTCTEDGYYVQYCDHCDYVGILPGEPAYGHDMDGKVVEIPSTCITPGTRTIYCDFCGEVSVIEEIPVNANHNLSRVAAVAPVCHNEGNVEYWYCVDCDALFTDANGRYLTNRKNVIVPAVTELAYVPAAEPCHVAGTYEYWYCPDCDAVYADAEGKILTNRKNLAIAPVVELVYVPATGSCHKTGYAEHWYCPDCDAVYADAEGKILTNRKNLEIAVAAPEINRLEPTCTVDGYEIKYCTVCGETVSLEILPATGHSEDVKIFIIEPTCTEFGYRIEACLICGEAAKTVAIPATGHTYVDTVVDPTMMAEGYTEHTCSECGHSYIDSYVDPIQGEILLGDMNGDGKINNIDINIMTRIISGSIIPTEVQYRVGDLNGDGRVNGLDGNALSKRVSGQ